MRCDKWGELCGWMKHWPSKIKKPPNLSQVSHKSKRPLPGRRTRRGQGERGSTTRFAAKPLELGPSPSPFLLSGFQAFRCCVTIHNTPQPTLCVRLASVAGEPVVRTGLHWLAATFLSSLSISSGWYPFIISHITFIPINTLSNMATEHTMLDDAWWHPFTNDANDYELGSAVGE